MLFPELRYRDERVPDLREDSDVVDLQGDYFSTLVVALDLQVADAGGLVSDPIDPLKDVGTRADVGQIRGQVVYVKTGSAVDEHQQVWASLTVPSLCHISSRGQDSCWRCH